MGMLGAMGYEAGRAFLEKCVPRLRTALQWASAAGLALCVWVVLQILQAQCTLGLQSTASLRLGQLKHRLPLALALLGCILTSAFLPRPLEWLLGNRLMRWLSGLTFNFYLAPVFGGAVCAELVPQHTSQRSRPAMGFHGAVLCQYAGAGRSADGSHGSGGRLGKGALEKEEITGGVYLPVRNGS